VLSAEADTPADKNARVQRAKLDLLRIQDEAFAQTLGGHDAVESAIKNYEMAYRMQALVPDVFDLTRESEATKKLYGIDSAVESKRLSGIQCLDHGKAVSRVAGPTTIGKHNYFFLAARFRITRRCSLPSLASNFLGASSDVT
jgi:hypothetical protein